MTSLQSSSKNRGEWAEIVSFFICLAYGRVATVRSGSKYLEKTGGAVVISEISTERGSKTIKYKANRFETLKSWDFWINNEYSKTFPIEEVRKDCDCVLNSVRAAADANPKGNLSVDNILPLLDKYCLGSGKTKSSLKQDVELVLIDPDGIPLDAQGFSIKSFVGGDPTIFNASRAARFKFRLDGAKAQAAKEIENEVKSGKKRAWVQDLFKALESINAFTQTIEIPDRKFERNLELLDFNMPMVMGAMLKLAYCSGEMSIKKNLEQVILSDPLGYGKDSNIFYTYRVKRFLRAAALGFSSSKPWNGREGADGGMLLMNKKWELFCMISTRKDLENYLVNSCRFESASTNVNKHGGYGNVTEEWHGTYVDLLLQIREGDPFKYGKD